jgi:hypothetical protein
MGNNKNKKKHKNNTSKKKHTVRNKVKKDNKDTKVNKVKKEAKKDVLKYTHLLQTKWYMIVQFYVFALLIRWLVIDHSITRPFMYYIKFILFFTIQYFGYAILLLASIFSIESIISMTSDTLITAVKRLLEPFKPHPFLIHYPINDYVWTHLLPKTVNIAFTLIGIGLLIFLFFMFIIPFAILLLGYTK